MKTISVFLLLAALLSGCTAIATEPRPSSYSNEYSGIVARAPEAGSLFTSDSAVLSDEVIQRILAHRYSPQKQNRIGILVIGESYWFGWSDELTRAGTEVQVKLVNKLRSSPLIYDASYLPSLLMPEKKTVGHFREAGARYQADMLLIYRGSCRTYEKYRIFNPDKSKSYCNVEAVLLDTRSGIVPFTVTATRDFVAEKSDQDLNIRETMRRAELNALGDALGEVGDQVVKFFSTARQAGKTSSD